MPQRYFLSFNEGMIEFGFSFQVYDVGQFFGEK
jgi:hypothetical protein